MPRTQRIVSSSGTYHIMLRGNEQKDIFFDDEDRYRFLETLSKKSIEEKYDLFSYCLMSNHIHLLIREVNKPIHDLIRRVGTSYVYYFNKKYQRIGHLFQDRYRSEPVESDAHLLAAVRYIHKNPVNAGMVRHENYYRWSSYNEYLSGSFMNVVNSEFILSIFSYDKNKAIDAFKEYSNNDEEYSFIEIKSKENTIKDKENRNKLNKKDAQELIEKCLREKSIQPEYLKDKMYCETRQDLILFLRTNTGMSLREIAEMLQISRWMVKNTKT